MSSVTETLDKVRSDAQMLQERIQKQMAADDAARHVQFEEDAKTAHQLAAALKSLNFGQDEEIKRHATEAAAQLSDVENQAKNAMSATGERLKEANKAMMERAESAVAHLRKASKGAAKT